MSDGSSSSSRTFHNRIYYGWYVVIASTILVGFSTGLMFSYSVFFKPLAEHFSWDRATVSLIYSAAQIIRGVVSIGIGLLADKYGAKKISIACGVLAGLGLILSSQVNYLWQLFITFGIIEAIGLSGGFVVGTSLVSRWFTKRRGLALGIVSTGSGLGTILIVPGAERLINLFNWSQAFLYCGIATGVVMIAAAFLLRAPPSPDSGNNTTERVHPNPLKPPQDDFTLRRAIKDSRFILILITFFLFFFSIQLIMVHLVNYATDIGISPLVAASFISIIGAVSIIGRLSTGMASDKIGIHNTLILTCFFLMISFICLIFTKSLWSFYLFAVLYSLPYGGEVPLLPLFVGTNFGTKNMATLIGVGLFIGSIGGALGVWVAGEIFDTTQSYHWAFIGGAIAGLLSLIIVLILKRQYRREQQKA